MNESEAGEKRREVDCSHTLDGANAGIDPISQSKRRKTSADDQVPLVSTQAKESIQSLDQVIGPTSNGIPHIEDTSLSLEHHEPPSHHDNAKEVDSSTEAVQITVTASQNDGQSQAGLHTRGKEIQGEPPNALKSGLGPVSSSLEKEKEHDGVDQRHELPPQPQTSLNTETSPVPNLESAKLDPTPGPIDSAALKEDLTNEQLIQALISVPEQSVESASPAAYSSTLAIEAAGTKKTTHPTGQAKGPTFAAKTSPTINNLDAKSQTGLSPATLNHIPDLGSTLRQLSNLPESPRKQTSVGSDAGSQPISAREDRKSEPVISTELLGNALAAVANATNARSNATHSPPSAATLGNIAAITANISNLLQSSPNFAAAAVVAAAAQQKQHQQQIRGKAKSEARANGAAHRHLVPSPGSKRKSTTQDAMNGIMRTATSASQNDSSTDDRISKAVKDDAGQSQVDRKRKPQLIVKNEQVWKAVEGKEEKMLGFYQYVPEQLLPNLEEHVNGILQVRIQAKYLSYNNMCVRKRALWGTDIYTDDSDIVAMIIHSGKYQLPFKEPEVQPNDSFALAIAGKFVEAANAARQESMIGERRAPQEDAHDHDLDVTIRVLPKLRDYASTIRHWVKSRAWGGNHDGVSLYVERVVRIQKGEARPRGRSSLKADLWTYETFRKRALGLQKSQ